jgi:hypothetical protein
MSPRRQEDDNPVLNAAVDYIDRGFAVLPVCSANPRLTGAQRKESAKLPLSYWLFLRPLVDTAKARAVFERHPTANLAVATGRTSGILVIDIDGDRGGFESMQRFDLPETLTVETGNGLHLYYLHPFGEVDIPNCHDGLARGIDVKGERGNVVAPPSRHASGRHYRWRDPAAPISALPPETLRLILRLPYRSLLRSSARNLILKHLLFPLNGLIRHYARHLYYRDGP